MAFTFLEYLCFSLRFTRLQPWQHFEPETLALLEMEVWTATYPNNELSDFLSTRVYIALVYSHV